MGGFHESGVYLVTKTFQFPCDLSEIVLVAEEQPSNVLDNRNFGPQPVDGVQKYWETVSRVPVSPLVTDLAERLARWSANDNISCTLGLTYV